MGRTLMSMSSARLTSPHLCKNPFESVLEDSISLHVTDLQDPEVFFTFFFGAMRGRKGSRSLKFLLVIHLNIR